MLLSPADITGANATVAVEADTGPDDIVASLHVKNRFLEGVAALKANLLGPPSQVKHASIHDVVKL